ncbi:hypothetical protein [Sphingomonas sp.]|uniref:hypothetical protein n=1 Tax=Sphingomonas sp. TaxID=28214 RepID=UPI001EB6D1FD|nr:hypothetical protein [Sphingomonas sp.]MBX3595208.1 hypothetical protein [Sphingomonas sp.]
MKAVFALAIALAAGVTPAFAKKEKVVFVETAVVKDAPAVALDPAKAYVMVRSDAAVPLHLMRVPSAEDQQSYDRLRGEALVEARAKYVKKLAAYERDKAAYDKTPKGQPRPELPVKPVEPTEANFEFTPFGLLTGVSIGPMNRFAKSSEGEKVSTYLQAMTPGTYRVYGMMSVMPNGAVYGNCFCMGSIKFEAKAGQITDLGRFGARDVPGRAPGDSSQPAPPALEFKPAVAGTGADPRLANYTIVPAVLRPVGKLPNYFGLAIGRFPEIPGVMRYDRDRIVDLTAGN